MRRFSFVPSWIAVWNLPGGHRRTGARIGMSYGMGFRASGPGRRTYARTRANNSG
jgi:hypothetical protein